MRLIALIALTLCLMIPAGACSRKAGGSKVSKLEFRVDELEAENRRLAAERGELDAKVTELSRALDAASGSSAGAVVAALPRCAGLAFGRLTSLFDRDGSPGFEGIDVYIRTMDGRQRFVQVAGTMRVQVIAHPAAGEADSTPRVLAEVTLDPIGLRDAYRSGMTGTHYAARLGLHPPIGVSGASEEVFELVAQFEDAVTGVRHLATKSLDIGP